MHSLLQLTLDCLLPIMICMGSTFGSTQKPLSAILSHQVNNNHVKCNSLQTVMQHKQIINLAECFATIKTNRKRVPVDTWRAPLVLHQNSNMAFGWCKYIGRVNVEKGYKYSLEF